MTRKTWYSFIFLALIGFFIWYKFTYPQFSFIDLSIKKNSANKISKDFISKTYGKDILSGYKDVTVIKTASSADKYLQRSIGFEKELEFFKQHNFELFFWKTRFFKEKEKEQFYVTVSAKTGEVTGFSRIIEANAARDDQTEEEAKQKVLEFLKSKFQFDPKHYILHANLATKLDNRTNYSFSWEKKDVFVRWSEEEDTGGGKLLVGATVSGDEILSFYKNSLKIPDQFHRYLRKKMNVGSNFAVIIRIMFFIVLTASIFFVVVRRNDIVMHTVKRFCIALTCSLFVVQLLCYFNEFQSIIYRYPTTSSMTSYLWRYIVGVFFDVFIVTISILMPCLAGESLHYETSNNEKEGSFLHYLISTFFSRNIFTMICFGYVIAIVLIGFQSAIFELGKKYLGVWVEYTWLAQFSESYFPFFTVFVVGANAAFSEELTFRLFSINLGKKFLKNTFLAVLIPSLLWGFGHSTYPVFPMWFRGLEVTCLGLFLSFIYLKYGIIPVIVAHYLFDAFLGSSAYLLGHSNAYLFNGSIFILALPLIFGIIAYILNRPEDERNMTWKLSKHQRYNLEILKHYITNKGLLNNKSEDDLSQLKEEIMSHGWDIAVVEIALRDLKAQ